MKSPYANQIVKVSAPLYMARELAKLAELPEPPPDFGEPPQEEYARSKEPPIKHPILHALKATIPPALAFGVGTAAGYGAQRGVEKLLGKSLTPGKLQAVAPVLGGAMGLAYNQYKALEQQELRRALEAHQSKSSGTVPTE